MSLGNSLYNARKKSGLSQEAVAEKLGVSRQTISKWELDETLPDIRQSKKLSQLYHLTLDELIDFDIDQKEIEEGVIIWNQKSTASQISRRSSVSAVRRRTNLYGRCMTKRNLSVLSK